MVHQGVCHEPFVASDGPDDCLGYLAIAFLSWLRALDFSKSREAIRQG